MYHHHELMLNESEILMANAVVIGPGPNAPFDAGELMSFLPKLIENRMPILGICLGHQALGEYFGMKLTLANQPMHGKSSEMIHAGELLFQGIPSPMKIGRYHSLIVEKSENNVPIEILSEVNHEVMSFKHKELPIFGVQFHPESVLTPYGQKMIQNWVNSLM